MIWTKRILLALPFAAAAALTVLINVADRLHLRREHIAGYGFLFATPWAWLLDRGWFGDVRSRWAQLDRTTLTPLPETDSASYPFWSPDGKHIGFFTSNALKIVDVAGRSVMDLCAIEQGRGGTWNNRGEIVFGTRTTGLFRVPAAGGTPVPLTKRTAREANHRFPTFLPDGNHLAYVVQSPLLAQVRVISLDDPRPTVLPGVISSVAFSQG